MARTKRTARKVEESCVHKRQIATFASKSAEINRKIAEKLNKGKKIRKPSTQELRDKLQGKNKKRIVFKKAVENKNTEVYVKEGKKLFDSTDGSTSEGELSQTETVNETAELIVTRSPEPVTEVLSPTEQKVTEKLSEIDGVIQELRKLNSQADPAYTTPTPELNQQLSNEEIEISSPQVTTTTPFNTSEGVDIREGVNTSGCVDKDKREKIKKKVKKRQKQKAVKEFVKKRQSKNYYRAKFYKPGTQQHVWLKDKPSKQKFKPEKKLTREKRHIPAIRALQEIRYYQTTQENLIGRLPFQRVIRELTLKHAGQDMRWSELALRALQEAAETYVVGLFEDATLCTVHAKRTTLMKDDILVARRIRGEKQ